MSMSPIGSSVPVSSPRKLWRRRAKTAPRVWMPTTASRVGSGFFSAISWAIRRSVRLRSSCSSTTFSLILLPSWPRGTWLKDGLNVAAGCGCSLGVGRRRGFFSGHRGNLPLPPVPGAVLGQAWIAPLGQRHHDLVEVARGDAVGEHLTGLLQRLADVVAGGDVDEGKHLH